MAGSGGLGAGWRVFISHTSELREFPAGLSYVAAVERAVSAAGHVIVDMADFPAADRVPAELCAERVRECDVYVGVLGTRYGSPVRDKPEVSYTELEFEAATAAGLDRLVFVLDTNSPEVGIPPARLIDLESGARQEAFRRRIRDIGLVIGSFTNPAGLEQLVERSLRELADRPPAPGQGRRERVRRVWNVPARNPGFTGRDGLLAAVHSRLAAGDRAVVQALAGMGGVGKTQLAIEYAHRFVEDYDLAWWVDAKQGGLIGDQFAALGIALGCVQAGAGAEAARAEAEAARAAVLGELGQRNRWLLVFDNAEDPADVRSWLPGGAGHVLITSREHRWAEVAVPVEVDVLARGESVAILLDRVAGLGAVDADRLAAELGDLPLAIAQAAGFMAATAMMAGEYLGLLATRARQLLAQGETGSYPESLAAATGLIADRLVAEDPAAAELASLCAFLAPEPIPEDLFTSAAGELPGELADRAADSLAWRQTLARLARQSLARVDQRGLVMHRLTQAILRDRLNDERRRTLEQTVARLLAAARLGAPDDQSGWQKWAQIVPHLLSAPALANIEEDEALRARLDDAGWYLFWRDDPAARRQLYKDSYRRRKRSLGRDHQDTLASAGGLAYAMNELGDHEGALELQRDTYDRCRRILGPEDRETLYAANALAIFLNDSGELERARELHEASQLRRRLFPDDRDWLYSANRLAGVLRELGDTARARDLFEETYEKCRRMLGPDNLETLNVAGRGLAQALDDLGEGDQARQLRYDIYNRCRRVFGPDHPVTVQLRRELDS